MIIQIPLEDDNEDKMTMTFDTDELESDEIVSVTIDNGEDGDSLETLLSFSLFVSDLAAVTTALEKIRNDSWLRENNVR